MIPTITIGTTYPYVFTYNILKIFNVHRTRYWDRLFGTHRDPHSVKLFNYHKSGSSSLTDEKTGPKDELLAVEKTVGTKPENSMASSSNSVWTSYLGATLNTKVE